MTVACAFADPTSARTQLRVAVLDQWAAAGVALMKTVAESGRSVIDTARLLYRISQAVRLAIALAMRLSQPDNPAFPPAPAKPRAPRTAEPEAVAAKAQSEDARAEEPVRRPGSFRDREVSDDAILRRPLAEIVKLICRALGVTPDWSLWLDAEAPMGSETAPEPDRPKAVVAPPPDPLRAIPELRPRPGAILDRPSRPPPAEPLRTRLLGSCAIGALIPTFPPIAPWRAVAAAGQDPGPVWNREPSGSLMRQKPPSYGRA